jgi:hypothetical protein
MRNLSQVIDHEKGVLHDGGFKTNVQAEILCTGDTFRVRNGGVYVAMTYLYK